MHTTRTTSCTSGTATRANNQQNARLRAVVGRPLVQRTKHLAWQLRLGREIQNIDKNAIQFIIIIWNSNTEQQSRADVHLRDAEGRTKHKKQTKEHTNNK